MPKTSDQPLLANDGTSSEHSQDSHHLDEEDALLTGQRKPEDKRYGGAFWRQIGLYTWAVLATVAAVVLGALYGHQQQAPSTTSSKPEGKRNLIFMVSDGMGPTSLSLTRSFRQFTSELPYNDTLVLDQHLIGSSRTRSSSSLITDSAAGATAFSCGQKSYNGAISVLPDHSLCGTVLEAAKKAGYLTGLVVTTRLTDATPACFASHAKSRSLEDSIAEQIVGISHPLGRVVDLMLGGGRCHFLPNSSSHPPSYRDDNKDVIALAKEEEDFTYISTRSEFDALDTTSFSPSDLPLLGLFADTDIPYEVDRVSQDEVYPSLDEMAHAALQVLSSATRDSEQGFFIMIEGSRIDHAGHSNDPVAQVHEVLAYDRTIKSVLEFLENDSTPGVMISTSDHETGGLATARQLHDSYPEYRWFPSVLANASHSASYLSADLKAYYASHLPHAANSEDKSLLSYIRETTLSSGLGINDASAAEIARLIASLAGKDPWGVSRILADMISRRAGVGWTTHGHSAVDVNIYASTRDPALVGDLLGNHENTDVGRFLAGWLDLEDGVKAVTRGVEGSRYWGRNMRGVSTKERWTGWMEGSGDGSGPGGEKGQWTLDEYDGDFRRH